METFPYLFLLACFSALLDWSDAFPIGAARQNLRGDASSEPNVVLQSVVVGKKPEIEIDDYDDCPGCSFSNMNIIMRRLFQYLYPQTYRFKRDDNKAETEEFDGKTIERLIEAMEGLKQEVETSENSDLYDSKEGEEETRRGRMDQRKRRDGSLHRSRDEEDDYGARKSRKGESDGFRRRPKDDEEEHHRYKKMQDRRKKNYRKKDWREEQDRRSRHRETLADSWPRRIPEDDLYLPLQFHHHPSHRLSGEFIP